MSKKRTKADELQRNVEQLEKRQDALPDYEINEQQREAAASTKEEQIRQRAYELYEARGREEGHELDDWLQAEAKIRPAQRRATAA